VVYVSNITSDPKTGIGGWTDQQIIEALRLGKHPDGSQLFPIMPYPALSGMADQDVQDLVTFLRTVPAIENEVPANQLNVSVPPFQPRTPPPATAPTAGLKRGEYIVNVASHCSDCHTTRNPDGSPDMSKYLAGAMIEGEIASNITPDTETGIGAWTEQQIVDFLHTGQRPDGSPLSAVSLMNLVMQGGLKNITNADAQAVAAYLKSVPAVKNEPAAQMAAPAETPPALPESGGEVSGSGFLSVGLALLGIASLLAGLLVYRQQYHN
jgi:mono/diheme cytochrome c family protein